MTKNAPPPKFSGKPTRPAVKASEEQRKVSVNSANTVTKDFLLLSQPIIHQGVLIASASSGRRFYVHHLSEIPLSEVFLTRTGNHLQRVDKTTLKLAGSISIRVAQIPAQSVPSVALTAQIPTSVFSGPISGRDHKVLQLLQKGKDANTSGDFSTACACFEAAYALSVRAGMLVSAANMRLKLNQPQTAAAMYRYVLTECSLLPAEQQMARRKLAEAQALLKKQPTAADGGPASPAANSTPAGHATNDGGGWSAFGVGNEGSRREEFGADGDWGEDPFGANGGGGGGFDAEFDDFETAADDADADADEFGDFGSFEDAPQQPPQPPRPAALSGLGGSSTAAGRFAAAEEEDDGDFADFGAPPQGMEVAKKPHARIDAPAPRTAAAATAHGGGGGGGSDRRIAELERRLQMLEQTVSGGASKIDMLEHEQKLAQLTAQVDRRLTGVRKGMTLIHERLLAVETAMSKLPEHLGRFRDRVKGQAEITSAHSATLAELQQHLPALSAVASECGARVKELTLLHEAMSSGALLASLPSLHGDLEGGRAMKLFSGLDTAALDADALGTGHASEGFEAPALDAGVGIGTDADAAAATSNFAADDDFDSVFVSAPDDKSSPNVAAPDTAPQSTALLEPPANGVNAEEDDFAGAEFADDAGADFAAFDDAPGQGPGAADVPRVDDSVGAEAEGATVTARRPEWLDGAAGEQATPGGDLGSDGGDGGFGEFADDPVEGVEPLEEQLPENGRGDTHLDVATPATNTTSAPTPTNAEGGSLSADVGNWGFTDEPSETPYVDSALVDEPPVSATSGPGEAAGGDDDGGYETPAGSTPAGPPSSFDSMPTIGGSLELPAGHQVQSSRAPPSSTKEDASFDDLQFGNFEVPTTTSDQMAAFTETVTDDEFNALFGPAV